MGIVGDRRGKVQIEVDYWFEMDWFKRLDFKLADLEENLLDMDKLNLDRVGIIKKELFGLSEPLIDLTRSQATLLPATNLQILDHKASQKKCFMCLNLKDNSDLQDDICSWCRKQLTDYKM